MRAPFISTDRQTDIEKNRAPLKVTLHLISHTEFWTILPRILNLIHMIKSLLAHLCVVFSHVFVTFPYGVPGQVWYFIVSIPDICLPL